MRLVFVPILLSLALHAAQSHACDPFPGWQRHTPASAFASAQVVIRAQVISQRVNEGEDETSARVRVVRVLKGSFQGDVIKTSSAPGCGVGTFEVGREYIFFFPRAGDWFVNKLQQPWNMTPAQVLRAIDQQSKN